MAVTAAELLIKIQTAGADELAKVSTAVNSVGAGTRLAGANLKTFDATLNSLVASGKTYIEALKEMAASQGVLSGSIVSTSSALLKHMGIVDEVAAKTHTLVGANIAAGAAIRDMTGQANIRAVENLLSNVLGLGSAFQTIFPIVGAIAMVEEIGKMRERFDPLVEATKRLAEENKKLDQTYVTATGNIERYIEQQARATLSSFLNSINKALRIGNTATSAFIPSQHYQAEWMPSQHYDSGFSINNGTDTLPGGAADGSTLAPRMSMSSMLGTAAQLAGGALAIGQGINKGGVSGGLIAAGGAAAMAGSAISAVAKLAGALSPALAAAGPIGALVGAGLGIVSSLMPNGPAQRAKEIADELRDNQYLAPTARSITQGTDGRFVDFDAHGLLRTSTLRSDPTVAQPYQTSRNIDGVDQYQIVPGSTQKPYSGSAAGSGQAPQSNAGGNTYIIHAMDPRSFHDFLQDPANAHSIGESLATHLERHEGRASAGIRYITNTNR